jgi:hemoglobin
MYATSTASLYDRLGGRPRIAAIMNDVVANHLANPIVAPRFRQVTDLDKLRDHAINFVCAGTGGSEAYSGRDMRTAHTGMNISEQEFVAVIDDILAALDKHGVGPQERHEILAIAYSLKNDIVRV